MKVTIILAFVLGVLFSRHLWISYGRFFPMLKPFDGLPEIPYPFDLILLLFFIAFSIGWIIFERRSLGFAALSLLLIVICQDQMRWQPWVYLYLLLLLPFLFQCRNAHYAGDLLSCLQWIIAGVYVWSGIHKMNPNFLDGHFAEIMRVAGMSSPWRDWKPIGYALPIIEIFIGFALLVPRLRKFGVCAAVLVHVLILLYLSPLMTNQNSVVYPWNLAMIAIDILLFWNSKESMFTLSGHGRLVFMKIGIVLLVWLLPVLNFFGYWDHYLSFSLYSNKPSSFYVAIEKSELSKIDPRLVKYFVEIPGLQGGQLLDVNQWAVRELNVPFYPEMRALKKMRNKFCELNMNREHVVFLELYRSGEKTEYKNFTCDQTN